MNVPKNQNESREWIKALAPWLMMALGVWYFMGSADASQHTNTKQLDRIEANVQTLSNTVTEMRVTIGKLETKIGNLENPIIKRQNQAEYKKP